MDMSKFNFDFYDSLEKLTKGIQIDFVERLNKLQNENPDISERDLLLKIID